MIMVIILFFVFGFTCGSIIGKWHERREWNKLIEDGLIPKPRRWITRKIPDCTVGSNTFIDCVESFPMPDDYFDENGVW